MRALYAAYVSRMLGIVAGRKGEYARRGMTGHRVGLRGFSSHLESKFINPEASKRMSPTII